MTSFRKFHVGGKLNPTASQANAWNEAAIAHKQDRNRKTGSLEAKMRSASRVQVANGTGSGLNAFSVLQITGTSIDPEANEDEYLNKPALEGEQTSDDGTSKFVITQQYLADGEIDNNAVVSGVSYARLTGGSGYKYASTKSGQDTLEAGGSGQCVILYDPGPADEERTAIIKIGSGLSIRSAVISEKGDYNTHKILFTSGAFSESTSLDDQVITATEDIAYVGEEFDYRIEVGSPVRVALVDGLWWIVDAQQACRGYCIDDPQDTDYVYGWYFIAPVLTCCPEASGPMLMTTSDSGATYETATFQCNSDGTDRKWIFNGTKLYLSPMLEEGNVQFQTDQTPANCTIELKKYEGFITPYADCGIKQDSVCLHPLCGITGCANCDNGTPTYYEGAFTGQLTSNPIYNQTCSIQSPFVFRYEQNDTNACEWYTRFRGVDERTFRLQPENTPPSISSIATPSTYWEMPDGATFDYYGTNVFTLTEESNRCYGWPDTITVYPKISEIAEANCNPAVWRVITDDGFAASADSEVVCWEVPRFWLVEIAGVANDVCSGCDVFNGSFVLDYFSGTLGESADIASSCASGTPVNYRLSWGKDGSTWYMYLWCRTSSPNYYATYTKNLGSDAFGINCIGPNVLTLDSNSSDCQSWPSSVTIYPLT